MYRLHCQQVVLQERHLHPQVEVGGLGRLTQQQRRRRRLPFLLPVSPLVLLSPVLLSRVLRVPFQPFPLCRLSPFPLCRVEPSLSQLCRALLFQLPLPLSRLSRPCQLRLSPSYRIPL